MGMVEDKKKRVVVVGGGTGTYTVLSGLRHFSNEFELSAIVAMTDSGGSTGRLRDEFGYLPVGDVRMALAALASDGGGEDTLIRQLFLHRFSAQGGVHGHNFGNLFLVALTDILGSEARAIEAASRVLRVCGTVIPVTHERVHLCARYDDGVEVVGEHIIDEPVFDRDTHRIVDLKVTPRASLSREAAQALKDAHLIVVGPGDLYTSIIANCVVDGFKEAVSTASAPILYIANLMTKVGQTSGMGVKEHVDVLSEYIGRQPDHVLANTIDLPQELVDRYAEEHEFPVALNYTEPGYRERDLLATEEVVRERGDVLRRSLIRHDPHKLAHAIYEVLKGHVH